MSQHSESRSLGHQSLVTCQYSESQSLRVSLVTGHWSLVTDKSHRSLIRVIGHLSSVNYHWSLVTGHRSLIIGELSLVSSRKSLR